MNKDKEAARLLRKAARMLEESENKITLSEVFTGSSAEGYFYEDTGELVEANETAWVVTIPDIYGDEEKLYFSSKSNATAWLNENCNSGEWEEV